MTESNTRSTAAVFGRSSCGLIRTLLTVVVMLSMSDVGATDWPDHVTQQSNQGSEILVPEAASKRPRPILVLLPFTGGSATDLLDRWYREALPAHARARGYIVVLPDSAGSYEDYSTGAAWAATLKRYTEQIASDVAEAVGKYQGDATRVALAGYSMGGDLAWALIQRDRERYSGAVIMGSRASYREKGALERLAQRQARLFFFMGEQEDEVRMAGSRAAQAAAHKAEVAVHTGGSAGEHVTAPPSVFAEAIDYVLAYDGLPAVALTTMAAPPMQIEVDSSETDETDETEPEQVHVTGGYDRGNAKPVDYSRDHPLRTATTSDRPESLPGCDWQPFKDEKSGSWGYRDKAGRVTVEASYYEAEEFTDDGLARVWDDSRPGFINCKGDHFEVYTEVDADEFSDDLVRVFDYTHDSQGERLYRIGFVNRRGEMVVPARHEFATSFCDGVAKVGDGCRVQHDFMGRQMDVQCRRWSHINLSGKTVPPPPADEDCDDIRNEPRYHTAE